MWRDTLRGWRAFAFIYFVLITVLTFAELLGDLIGFTDLEPLAQFSGITPDLEAQRLVSLSILTTAICVASGVTAYGIFKKRSWTVHVGTIAGILLLLYMGYQMLSALFILTANNYGVLGAGATYGIFGLIGILLVRRGMRGVK